MAIYVDDLEKTVLKNAVSCDSIDIISGFFSIDILEKIAKIGKPTTFYYGMYLKNGISRTYYSEFQRLETSYPNLKIFIPIAYHVHTKCYIFRKGSSIDTVLIGSANASSSALCTTANSELLSPVDSSTDKTFINNYYLDIQSNSVPYYNPLIIPTVKGKVLSTSPKKARKAPKSWNVYTGNPFSAIIPLYTVKNGKAEVQKVDGLNWGNGPHASKSTNMESIIPIRKFQIENYPLLIPFNGSVGSGSGGKIQRMQSPIDMVWDDGTIMTMVFQQSGVEIPSKAKRVPGSAYRQYPKALTSNSGGEELGIYLRKRLGLPSDATVTYDDLRCYGRDYVTLTLTNSGSYELDFSI